MNRSVYDAQGARDVGGSIAAMIGAACLVGSVIVGIQLMAAMGAGSMVEAGGDQQLSQHPQLLTMAEILKLASAGATAWLVLALERRSKTLNGKRNGPALAFGMISAPLLAASAVVGLAPLYFGIDHPERIAPVAHGLGLASAAAYGLWAAILAVRSWTDKTLPRWLCITGGLLAIASFIVIVAPPAGLITALLSLIWLIGLAVILLRK